MSLPGDPKTVEDYKDVVKILKLKIIKQNKTIKELEGRIKNYEEQANSLTLRGDDLQISSRLIVEYEKEAQGGREERERNMSTLGGRLEVMKVMSRGMERLGVTPEGVFRMADYGYRRVVEADYFREVLGRMKLGLSQKQLSCLLFIFDENCSGYVTEQDYLNTLHAYKVGTEGNNHAYMQSCICRLSQMLHQDKIQLSKFYQEMEAASTSKGLTGKRLVELNHFEQHVKKSYQGKLSDREIVGAFQAIDLESQGYLEKSNFLYCITAYINKLMTGEQIARRSQNDWNSNSRNHYQSDMEKGSPKMSSLEHFNETSKVLMGGIVGMAQQGHSHPRNKGPEALNEASKALMGGFTGLVQPGATPNPNVYLPKDGTFGVNLYKIYEELILFDFHHRLTLKSFKKLILANYPSIPSQLLSELYKQIDDGFKGSIYFKDLIRFYLGNSSDNQMILRLIGKFFSQNDLDAEKYWFQFGLTPETDISKSKFVECMAASFESKEEKAWEGMWTMFDKGRGVCNVGSIIKVFAKYEGQA